MTASIPQRISRRAATGLFAAALSVATVLQYAPDAGAAPNWDIENYDDCMNDIDTNNSVEIIVELIKYCCDHNGGVWQGEEGHTVAQMCAAPAAMGGDGAQTAGPRTPKVPVDLLPIGPATVGTPSSTAAPLVPIAPVRPPMAG